MLVDEMGMWFTMVGKMRIVMKIISNIIQIDFQTILNSCFMKQFSRTKKKEPNRPLVFLTVFVPFFS